MLSFELAKRLKEAGYPQKFKTTNETHYTLEGKVMNTIPIQYHPDETIYAPSISELIEACGDGFSALKPFGKEWVAENKKKHGGMLGKTIEEAVTKLWLTINEKKQ